MFNGVSHFQQLLGKRGSVSQALEEPTAECSELVFAWSMLGSNLANVTEVEVHEAGDKGEK